MPFSPYYIFILFPIFFSTSSQLIAVGYNALSRRGARAASGKYSKLGKAIEDNVIKEKIKIKIS
jgi:hypothetical protein